MELLREFQKSIRENSYQGALALYHQMSVKLLAEFEHLDLFVPESFAAHHMFVEDMTAVEFAADADRAVESLCETIMEVHESGGADKTQDLIRQAMEYVRTHYPDPNLSLDSIAGTLMVSAGHMGRVFAGHSDTHLSEYISQVRIDHAKTMLTETDLTVQTIAESVGVTNSTYFFTLFKKYVGTTPARYRRSTQLA
jgi:YesN/AraC family two-component response regulator